MWEIPSSLDNLSNFLTSGGLLQTPPTQLTIDLLYQSIAALRIANDISSQITYIELLSEISVG